VSAILADTEVMAESAKAVTEVGAQFDIVMAETGITMVDTIPVPFLHEPAWGYSLAYQPGTANGIYLADNGYGPPETHGPIIDGKDPFKEQLNAAFAKHGINVHYIENWDLYHRASGEVHCGSNTKRALPANGFWWESGL
jgi:protein-arginine deiminase